MKINVSHIAKLASLQIKNEDIAKFEKQLSEVLDYINKLSEVNTENIEPTSQVTGLKNVLREDIAKSSIPQDSALSNAKSKHNNLFKVKGILDNE